MGNISDAFGKVTISAPTFSDIEVLVATHRVINAKAWTIQEKQIVSQLKKELSQRHFLLQLVGTGIFGRISIAF